MKKNQYIIPVTTVTTVELQQMIAYSGGGDQAQGEPQIDPTPDTSGDTTPNRSRSTYNCWDEDEFEEE